MATIAPRPETIALRHKRYEIVGNFDLVILALFFEIYLYDHALIQLILRFVTHLQLSLVVDRAPLQTYEKSIGFYFFPTTILHACFIIGHLIVPTPDTRSAAALVDFVGIPFRASRFRMLTIDLTTYALELVYLILCFDYAAERNDDEELDPSEDDFSDDEPMFEDGQALLTAEHHIDKPGSNNSDKQNSIDPLRRPIYKIEAKKTLKRLTEQPRWQESEGAGLSSGSSAVDQMLTDVGRRYRERRARRGQPVGRAEDIADEESGMALRLPGSMPSSTDTLALGSQSHSRPEPG